MTVHVTNGKITRTALGYEGHGILSFWLTLEFSGSGQGFGGFALDAQPAVRGVGGRQPHAYCGAVVAELLSVLAVERWEDVQGQLVRVRREREEWGPITAVGHIIEDRWFDPLAIAARFEDKAERT